MKKTTSYQRLKKEVKDQNSRICQLKEEIRALVLMEDEILERQIRLRWLITFKEDDQIMHGESNNKLQGIEFSAKEYKQNRDIKSKRPRIMSAPQNQNIKSEGIVSLDYSGLPHYSTFAQKQNIEDVEFLAMPCHDDYIISEITMQDVYNKIKDMAIRDGEVAVEVNDNNFVVRKAIENTIKK